MNCVEAGHDDAISLPFPSALPTGDEPAVINSAPQTTPATISPPFAAARWSTPPCSFAATRVRSANASHSTAWQTSRRAADNSPAPLRLPTRPSRLVGDTHNHDSDEQLALLSTHPQPARRKTADTTAASCPTPAARAEMPESGLHIARAKTQNNRS